MTTADGGKGACTEISKNETLLVNIGSTSTGGKVVGVKKDMAIALMQPVCTREGERSRCRVELRSIGV